MIEKISKIFWSETFWLPANVSWKDFESKDASVYRASVHDLKYSLVAALLLYIIKWVLEKKIFYTWAIQLGIKSKKPNNFNQCVELEQFYRRDKRPSEKIISEIAQSAQMNAKHVSRWFRKRRNFEKSDDATKFAESGYRTVFYLSLHMFGTAILLQSDFFYETKKMWTVFPNFNVTRGFFWYYMIEFGYYVCACFCIFTDVKRKDFRIMLTHHLVTLCLMAFSWSINMIPIGAYIIWIHDVVDYWMEIAKMAKYAKRMSLCNVSFAIFIVLWFLTRLLYFPFVLIYSTLFEMSYTFVAFYPFIVLLIALQFMHVFWFVLIMKVAIQALTSTDYKDSRSDSDMSSDSKSDSSQKNCANGTSPSASLLPSDLSASAQVCSNDTKFNTRVVSGVTHPHTNTHDKHSLGNAHRINALSNNKTSVIDRGEVTQTPHLANGKLAAKTANHKGDHTSSPELRHRAAHTNNSDSDSD